ncbi:UDP-glycosyltransferase 90A1-like protein [Tanacetum coccineum]
MVSGPILSRSGSEEDKTFVQPKTIMDGLARQKTSAWKSGSRTKEKTESMPLWMTGLRRVKEKGVAVREWVNQKEILEHEIVKGFVSHCGWNSVLESISASVPILAWPLSAEQPLNAKFVVDDIKIGFRVETCDGSLKGFVKGEGLEKKVKELMVGEKGKEVQK